MEGRERFSTGVSGLRELIEDILAGGLTDNVAEAIKMSTLRCGCELWC